MGVGFVSTLGRNADLTIPRDKLIEMAYQNIGVLPEGENMNADQLQAGIDRLELILREVDEAGKWRWTVSLPFHMPLISTIGVYDANSGFAMNCSEIISAVYRGKDGTDSLPLTVLSPESYERISNKLEPGDPRAVYLTDDATLNQRRLYIWPVPDNVGTQSWVTGTDNNSYRCIYPHTSASSTRPISGANWPMYWELGNGNDVDWTFNAQYLSAAKLRIVYRGPIFGFTTASTTPDVPPQLYRALLYRLCDDLADVYPTPGEGRDKLSQKYKGAYSDVFSSLRKKTNNIHNKVKYF